MKTYRFMKILCLVLFLNISNSIAHTVDDLATPLGGSSWETYVDLPTDSYTIDLYEIKDGGLGKRLTQFSAFNCKHNARIVIMSSDAEDKTTVTISTGGLSVRIPCADNFSNSPNHHFLYPIIPAVVTAGEYPLFGCPNETSEKYKNMKSDFGKNTEDFINGVVLKITSKNS
jgi:hypothetical protein